MRSAMLSNSCLQHLALPYNSFGPVGVSAIAEGLAANARLLSLDLSGNHMEVRNHASPSSLLLQHQHLSGPKSRKSVMFLRQHANRCNARTPYDKHARAKHDSMCIECSLQEEGAAMLAGALASNSTLAKLSLCDCRLEDDGMHAMARQAAGVLGRLRELELRRNNLSAQAALGLAALLAPRALHASSAKQSILAHLNLAWNPLGDAGVALLLPALRQCVHLKSLNLQDCDVGTLGVLLHMVMRAAKPCVWCTQAAEHVEQAHAAALTAAAVRCRCGGARQRPGRHGAGGDQHESEQHWGRWSVRAGPCSAAPAHTARASRAEQLHQGAWCAGARSSPQVCLKHGGGGPSWQLVPIHGDQD
jgi:Leucine Rich repeat